MHVSVVTKLFGVMVLKQVHLANGLPYHSSVQYRSHVCGHDEVLVLLVV